MARSTPYNVYVYLAIGASQEMKLFLAPGLRPEMDSICVPVLMVTSPVSGAALSCVGEINPDGVREVA